MVWMGKMVVEFLLLTGRWNHIIGDQHEQQTLERTNDMAETEAGR